MIKFVDLLLEKQRDLTPLLLRTTNMKKFVNAVTNRNPISFNYYGPRKGKDSVKGGKRVKVEGVALGLNKNGKLVLRAYVNPPSVTKKGFDKTHWRTYLLSRMSNVIFHENEQFQQKREQYKDGDDGSMSVTYATSDWGAKLKDKKIVKPKIEPTTEPKPEVQPTEPVAKPEVQPTQPTVKPEVQPTEPETQPTTQPQVEPTTQKPTVEPTAPVQNEPVTKKQELPQPKQKQKPVANPEIKPSAQPEEKPEENPEENDDEMLNESIRRIKRLMFL